jgi:hypothetical protein
MSRAAFARVRDQERSIRGTTDGSNRLPELVRWPRAASSAALARSVGFGFRRRTSTELAAILEPGQVAQFDREAPHSLSSPLAVQTHSLGAGASAHAGWQGSGCRGIISH